MVEENNFPDIDISELSLEQLEALQDLIATRIADIKNKEKEEVIELIRDAATAIGLNVEFSPIEKKRAKANPRYKNPQTGETWSGRGKTPLWLQKSLDEGKSLKDFEILEIQTHPVIFRETILNQKEIDLTQTFFDAHYDPDLDINPDYDPSLAE